MKRLSTILTLLSAIAVSSSALCAPAGSPSLKASSVQESRSAVDANTILRQITYGGSDSLSIDDPLGNSPVTARHDAGPPSTWRMSSPDCQDETCSRAERRWMSPTNWRQDRSIGLSTGWGDSNRQ
jgi:hypothetical protein